MHKTNYRRRRLRILLVLIAVFLNACGNSPEEEKAVIIQVDPLDPAGIIGSIDAEIQYWPKKKVISLIVTNNTAYEMTIGEPTVLYQKTSGEMYETLYPSLSDILQGETTIAGNDHVLSPGDSSVIDILPRSLKLTKGDYRIGLGTMDLVDPITGEVCFHRQNGFLHFGITE